MANGYTTNRFNYESPVDRLLNYTIPTFLDKELDRQADDDRFDLLREDRLNQIGDEKKRYSDKLVLDDLRYKAEIKEAEDDETYGRSLDKFNVISKIANLGERSKAIEILEATDLHPEAVDLVASSKAALDVQLKNVTTTMNLFSPEVFNPSQLSRIKNQLMLGNEEGAHQVGDKLATAEFSTPWVQAESRRILGSLKSKETEIAALGGLMTDDAKSRRGQLEEEKITLLGDFRELYNKDRPFDPIAEGQKFSKGLQDQLKEAGLGLKDKEAGAAIGSKYLQEINVFKQEYLTGSNRNNYTAAQRDSASQKLINDIIAKEKALPPVKKEKFDYSKINKLDAEGTALALAATAYALKNPAKKVYDYMGKKTVQAVGAVKEVWNMPASDITKFLDNVSLNTPGKPGSMMPKVEKLLEKINDLSGERKTPKVKAKLANLNSELDGQVKKVMKRFRQLKVSPALKDADLEKLIRNPNKWRLAKIKSLLSKPKALAPSMRKWGVFSASAKIGEAFGDPTGGIATGLGLPAVAKKVMKLYKKKGPKWVMSKLSPVVGKAISKRIVGGFATGAIGGPTAIATTIAGTGLAIYDIYQFLESLSEGGSEEEAVAVLQNAMKRDSTQAPDSTQAQIDSSRVADSTNWFLPAIK
jgi:hypothetical protein